MKKGDVMSSSGELCVNCHHPRAGGDDGVPCTECGARNGFAGMDAPARRRLRGLVGWLIVLMVVGAIAWRLPWMMNVRAENGTVSPLFEDVSWLVLFVVAAMTAMAKCVGDRLGVQGRWMAACGALLCVAIASLAMNLHSLMTQFVFSLTTVDMNRRVRDGVVAVIAFSAVWWMVQQLGLFAVLGQRAGLIVHAGRLSRFRWPLAIAMLAISLLMLAGQDISSWWYKTYLPQHSGAGIRPDTWQRRVDQALYELPEVLRAALGILLGSLIAYVVYVLVQVRDRLVEE